MTLREFFCLLAGIGAYWLAAWFLWIVTGNTWATILGGLLVFFLVTVSLDELTDRHRIGGW